VPKRVLKNISSVCTQEYLTARADILCQVYRTARQNKGDHIVDVVGLWIDLVCRNSAIMRYVEKTVGV
jgi:hypothetical protein